MRAKLGFLTVLFTSILFLSGCWNDLFAPSFSPPPSNADTGRFVLHIEGFDAGRSIIPTTQQEDFKTFTLDFYVKDADPQDITSVDRTKENLSEPISLKAAVYDLIVTAFLDENRETPAAFGSTTITIPNGGTVNETVELFAYKEGEGTFKWSIIFPSALTSAQIEIRPYEGAVGPPVTTIDLLIPSGNNNASTGLSAGFYRVSIQLENSAGQKAIRNEILHIYKNLDSTFTHTFTMANFFAELSGTVTITGTPAVTKTLTADTSDFTGTGNFHYQWYRGSSPITDTDSSTYTLVDDDKDAAITVTVMRDGYNGGVTSAAVLVAANNDSNPYGSGTLTDPYIITKFNLFSYFLGEYFDAPNTYYKLGGDIDLLEVDWIPLILDGGGLDGNGYTVSNLNNNLFKEIKAGAVVKNLRLDVNIEDVQYVGVIVDDNYGTVENCFVTGSVNGSQGAGGVVGFNYESGIVRYCYSICDVYGYSYAGGIVADNRGVVQNCVALNTEVKLTNTGTGIGRVAGVNEPDGELIDNYARSAGMTLTANGSTYAPVPNQNGKDGADVSAGQYNTQLFWQTTLGWNFTTIWTWDSGTQLPKLR